MRQVIFRSKHSCASVSPKQDRIRTCICDVTDTHHCEQHTTWHFFTIFKFSNGLFCFFPRTKKPSGLILAARMLDRPRIAFSDWLTSTASKRTKSTRRRVCCTTKMYISQHHMCQCNQAVSLLQLIMAPHQPGNFWLIWSKRYDSFYTVLRFQISSWLHQPVSRRSSHFKWNFNTGVTFKLCKKPQ